MDSLARTNFVADAHRGNRTTRCDSLTLLVAACAACAARGGFGFARNTATTFDVFDWLQVANFDILLNSAPNGPDYIDIWGLCLHAQLFRSNVRFRIATDPAVASILIAILLNRPRAHASRSRCPEKFAAFVKRDGIVRASGIGRDRSDPQSSSPERVLASNLTNPILVTYLLLKVHAIWVTHLLRKMLDTLRTELHHPARSQTRYGADQSDRREASRLCVRGRLCRSVRFAGNQDRQRSA